MLYRHKNLTNNVFGIRDLSGTFHSLLPHEEMILDFNNEWKGLIHVEKIDEERKQIKSTRRK